MSVATSPSADTAAAPNRWREMVFATRWLRSYDRQWFRPDLAACVTLAAYLLPAALGDAAAIEDFQKQTTAKSRLPSPSRPTVDP